MTQTPVFEIKDLMFSYQKGAPNVVKGINFKIHEGEIFGLLGPSGAGKSTTQKILTKLLTGYEGSVLYFGKPLDSYSNAYFEDVGVGFELPVHFQKLTALENMRFFQNLYHTQAPIEPLLERVGLLEDKDKLVGSFSKGMKMRLNFVRALLNQPKVLFLDEVTNGLDPTNARILKDMILEFKQAGGTVLLTTHLMHDVEALCDRVAFIKDGQIVESDTPRALKLKYGQRRVTVEHFVNGSTAKAHFELDGIGKNPKFLELLNTQTIETIHTGETSLEEIFIQITGRDVRE